VGIIESMNRTRQKRITLGTGKQVVVNPHLRQQIGGPSCMAKVTPF
jgi:hypothetical protein